MKKIGLALSGGGARGFAHVGLLRLLEEMKINVEFISGVSAGAIIGALYAAGFSSVNILKLLKQNSYFGFKNIMWHGDGFFSMEPLLKLLEKNIPDNQFESLQKKLFITATDLQKNNSCVFSSGELYPAVIASASIPVVFAPYEINNTKYVDGGLLNNLNVEVLHQNVDFIIGCHVNKLQTPLVNSKIQMIEHCFHLSISHKVYEQAKYCNIFIEPDLSKFKLFDSDKADEIVEIGYQSALQYKSELEKIF